MPRGYHPADLAGKLARMENKRRPQVRGEVGRIVPPRIYVEFMRDAARSKYLVEGSGAGVEAIVVLIAAVEIEFQAGEVGATRKSDGAVAIPERRIRRGAKNAA